MVAGLAVEQSKNNDIWCSLVILFMLFSYNFLVVATHQNVAIVVRFTCGSERGWDFTVGGQH